MAGHSKRSNATRIKGAIDVKRGELFSKLSQEITMAARMGGGELNGARHDEEMVYESCAPGGAALMADPVSNFDLPEELLARALPPRNC